MTGHANEARPDGSDVYSTSYDPDDEEPLSTAVVVAVADAADLDPQEIQETLYEVVDPDALDDIFRWADDAVGGGEVTFSLADYEVVVGDDGTITVRPAAGR